jgi:hypothetical protein
MRRTRKSKIFLTTCGSPIEFLIQNDQVIPGKDKVQGFVSLFRLAVPFARVIFCYKVTLLDLNNVQEKWNVSLLDEFLHELPVILGVRGIALQHSMKGRTCGTPCAEDHSQTGH